MREAPATGTACRDVNVACTWRAAETSEDHQVTDTRSTATPERRPAPSGSGGRRGPFARLTLFVRQVVAELRKVVKPTRNQLLTYTAVVLVFVSLMIAIVSVLDLVFGWAVFKVFG